MLPEPLEGLIKNTSTLEAANILLGMRQDIQAKCRHGRAPPGDWADMPNRDDYMVRGVVNDPNRRAYDCLRAPGVRATLLNAQTGQCIPLDDPIWVPEVTSSHLLVGTITTIASHVDCALGRAWRMPMFYPQLMAATAMLEKLQKYFKALNEAVLGKRLGTAPFSIIAGHLAPELRIIPDEGRCLTRWRNQRLKSCCPMFRRCLIRGLLPIGRRSSVGMATHSGSHGLRMSPMELPGPRCCHSPEAKDKDRMGKAAAC